MHSAIQSRLTLKGGLLERFKRFLSKFQVSVERWLAFAAAVIIGVMMLLTSADVFMRKVLHRPIAGSYEIIMLLAVVVVFFGLAYVQSRNGHIKIGVLRDRLPAKYHRHIDIVMLSLALGIFIVMTWQSAINTAWAINGGNTIMGAIQITTWPSRLAVPVGAGLVSLRLLVQIVQLFRGKSLEGESERLI